MDRSEQVKDGFEAEKLDLLQQILSIAQTQMALIQQDLPSDLLRALRQRERVIHQIERLEARRKECSAAETATDEESLQIRQTIESILLIDSQCAVSADEKLRSYKADIKSLAKASKQVGAYAHPYGAAHGQYFDTKQ